MKLSKIAEITEGKLIGQDVEVVGFEFDSRRMSPQKAFVALKGQRDGHEFLNDAASKGALAAIVSKNSKDGRLPRVLVKDTLEAFSKIAAYKRSTFKGKVVGVTGSVGKTTTKEMIAHCLSETAKVEKNPESYNNLIGVSYTISNLDNGSDYLVQELGTNRYGEIQHLASIAKPDIAVLTGVFPSHMEGFSSFEKLREEKLSILNFSKLSVLPQELSLFAKADVIVGRDVKLLQSSEAKDGTFVSVEVFGKRLDTFIPLLGDGGIAAFLFTLAVFAALELDLNVAAESVRSFKPPKWRMNILNLSRGTLIIDCYNSNPKSAENALKVLSRQSRKKVAILGDMLELGELSEKEHRKLGRTAKKLGIDRLIAVGKFCKLCADEFGEGAVWFKDVYRLLKSIDSLHLEDSAVLLKASRAMALEILINPIKEILS